MASKKYRMGEAGYEGKTLTCSRGTMWPPIEVEVYGGVEEARAEGLRADQGGPWEVPNLPLRAGGRRA